MKYCGNELSYILAHISNVSLTTGVFPDALKLAKIVPIFKNGSKKVVSNYRPISVLSAFSKIFERIMYTRLDNYLDINDILHQSQFGFRKKLSTSMALLELTEEISKSIDDRNYTVGFSLILPRPLILLITKFYYKNYTIMACRAPQTSGSGATWKIGDNLLLSTVLLLAALPYRVVSRKVQFLAHCSLFCTLMI